MSLEQAKELDTMKRNIKHEQKIIRLYGALGFIFVITVMLPSWFFLINNKSTNSTISIVASIMCYPAILLIALVLNIGMRRFAGDENIRDGGRSNLLKVHQSLLSNTMEQTLIFLLFMVFFSFALPIQHIYMIYVTTFLFIIGRVAFIIGYLVFPIYRAFGFAVTMLPCVVLFLLCLFPINS